MTAAGEAARTFGGVGEIKGAHVTPRQNNSGVCLVAAVGARERVCVRVRAAPCSVQMLLCLRVFDVREKEKESRSSADLSCCRVATRPVSRRSSS